MSDTETGWWKLGSRSDACGSLEEQSVPPLPPQHGYLMTRDHGEALRFSHSTSSFPSYIAIRKTSSCLCHVCGKHQGEYKEESRGTEPKVKDLSEDSLRTHIGNAQIKMFHAY